MEIDELKKQTIRRLRETKKEHDLTISNIMDMLEKKGCYVSEATVKRLFSENSDPLSFKYRDTIAPLADVLLDLYSDKSGSEDIAALKAMIHDKNKMINILIAKNEEQKADYDRRVNHLQKQLEKYDEHLMFREKIIEKLLDKIIKE